MTGTAQAPTAKTLIARARRRHGLMPEEMRRMTLSDLAAYEEDLRQETQEREHMHNLRMANLMTLIANIHRNPKSRRRPYTAEDFYKGPRPHTNQPEHAETLLNKFKVLAGRYPKTDNGS